MCYFTNFLNLVVADLYYQNYLYTDYLYTSYTQYMNYYTQFDISDYS